MILLVLAVGALAVGATTAPQADRKRTRRWFNRTYREVKDIIQEAGSFARDAFEAAVQEIPRVAERADSRYQEFVAETVDPLLGGERNRQLTAVVSSGKLDVTRDERQLNRYVATSLLSMSAAAVALLLFPPLILLALATALYSTQLIFLGAYRAIRERRMTLDVLGSLYFLGTFAGGFFVAAGFGLFAFYLSEKLVFVTQDRSKKSLVEVFGQQPRTAWVVLDGVEVEAPFESVKAGDSIVVQAGQIVPADGVIVQGIATVDQHKLTGEGQPVEKGVGDPVLAATLMVSGRVHVRVEKTGQETTAAQIGVMLNNTTSFQASIVSKAQQLANRSAPPTLVLALVALPLAGYRYMVTILGAAIGLNIRITAPIAMLNFLKVAAQQGILVKDGRSLELLHGVDTVIFDKTGTLTLDQPVVERIHELSDVDARTLLLYTAAAEHRQTHPIARSILAEAATQGLTLPEIDDAHYEIGYGLSVQIGGHRIRVGSSRYMALENLPEPSILEGIRQQSQERGNSLVLIAVDDNVAGVIELRPTLRPEARKVVQDLRGRNLKLYIISGDQEQPTRQMAESLGISDFFANTLPENKASHVEKLQAEGRVVCFVGDGINDSIALKKANVSVSVRGASTAATDTAQVVLMSQGLEHLPLLFDLSREFNFNMKAGVAVAVGQGVVVITGAMLSMVGIVTGTLIWEAALLAGLGIAMLPLHKYRSQEAKLLPPGPEWSGRE